MDGWKHILEQLQRMKAESVMLKTFEYFRYENQIMLPISLLYYR